MTGLRKSLLLATPFFCLLNSWGVEAHDIKKAIKVDTNPATCKPLIDKHANDSTQIIDCPPGTASVSYRVQPNKGFTFDGSMVTKEFVTFFTKDNFVHATSFQLCDANSVCETVNFQSIRSSAVPAIDKLSVKGAIKKVIPEINDSVSRYQVIVPSTHPTVARVRGAGAHKVSFVSFADATSIYSNTTIVPDRDRGDLIIYAVSPSGDKKQFVLSWKAAGTRAALTDLSFSAGKLSPEFDPSQTFYSLNVPFNQNRKFIEVNAQTFFPSVITINGGEAVNTTSLTSAFPMYRNSMRDELIVSVRSDSGMRIYHIMVDWSEGILKNSNFLLSSLRVFGGDIHEEFNPRRVTYSAFVPRDVDNVAFRLTTASPKSIVFVNGVRASTFSVEAPPPGDETPLTMEDVNAAWATEDERSKDELKNALTVHKASHPKVLPNTYVSTWVPIPRGDTSIVNIKVVTGKVAMDYYVAVHRDGAWYASNPFLRALGVVSVAINLGCTLVNPSAWVEAASFMQFMEAISTMPGLPEPFVFYASFFEAATVDYWIKQGKALVGLKSDDDEEEEEVVVKELPEDYPQDLVPVFISNDERAHALNGLKFKLYSEMKSILKKYPVKAKYLNEEQMKIMNTVTKGWLSTSHFRDMAEAEAQSTRAVQWAAYQYPRYTIKGKLDKTPSMYTHAEKPPTLPEKVKESMMILVDPSEVEQRLPFGRRLSVVRKVSDAEESLRMDLVEQFIIKFNFNIDIQTFSSAIVAAAVDKLVTYNSVAKREITAESEVNAFVAGVLTNVNEYLIHIFENTSSDIPSVEAGVQLISSALEKLNVPVDEHVAVGMTVSESAMHQIVARRLQDSEVKKSELLSIPTEGPISMEDLLIMGNTAAIPVFRHHDKKGDRVFSNTGFEEAMNEMKEEWSSFFTIVLGDTDFKAPFISDYYVGDAIANAHLLAEHPAYGKINFDYDEFHTYDVAKPSAEDATDDGEARAEALKAARKATESLVSIIGIYLTVFFGYFLVARRFALFQESKRHIAVAYDGYVQRAPKMITPTPLFLFAIDAQLIAFAKYALTVTFMETVNENVKIVGKLEVPFVYMQYFAMASTILPIIFLFASTIFLIRLNDTFVFSTALGQYVSQFTKLVKAHRNWRGFEVNEVRSVAYINPGSFEDNDSEDLKSHDFDPNMYSRRDVSFTNTQEAMEAKVKVVLTLLTDASKRKPLSSISDSSVNPNMVDFEQIIADLMEPLVLSELEEINQIDDVRVLKNEHAHGQYSGMHALLWRYFGVPHRVSCDEAEELGLYDKENDEDENGSESDNDVHNYRKNDSDEGDVKIYDANGVLYRLDVSELDNFNKIPHGRSIDKLGDKAPITIQHLIDSGLWTWDVEEFANASSLVVDPLTTEVLVGFDEERCLTSAPYIDNGLEVNGEYHKAVKGSMSLLQANEAEYRECATYSMGYRRYTLLNSAQREIELRTDISAGVTPSLIKSLASFTFWVPIGNLEQKAEKFNHLINGKSQGQYGFFVLQRAMILIQLVQALSPLDTRMSVWSLFIVAFIEFAIQIYTESTNADFAIANSRYVDKLIARNTEVTFRIPLLQDSAFGVHENGDFKYALKSAEPWRKSNNSKNTASEKIELRKTTELPETDKNYCRGIPLVNADGSISSYSGNITTDHRYCIDVEGYVVRRVKDVVYNNASHPLYLVSYTHPFNPAIHMHTVLPGELLKKTDQFAREEQEELEAEEGSSISRTISYLIENSTGQKLMQLFMFIALICTIDDDLGFLNIEDGSIVMISFIFGVMLLMNWKLISTVADDFTNVVVDRINTLEAKWKSFTSRLLNKPVETVSPVKALKFFLGEIGISLNGVAETSAATASEQASLSRAESNLLAFDKRIIVEPINNAVKKTVKTSILYDSLSSKMMETLPLSTSALAMFGPNSNTHANSYDSFNPLSGAAPIATIQVCSNDIQPPAFLKAGNFKNFTVRYQRGVNETEHDYVLTLFSNPLFIPKRGTVVVNEHTPLLQYITIQTPGVSVDERDEMDWADAEEKGVPIDLVSPDFDVSVKLTSFIKVASELKIVRSLSSSNKVVLGIYGDTVFDPFNRLMARLLLERENHTLDDYLHALENKKTPEVTILADCRKLLQLLVDNPRIEDLIIADDTTGKRKDDDVCYVYKKFIHAYWYVPLSIFYENAQLVVTNLRDYGTPQSLNFLPVAAFELQHQKLIKRAIAKSQVFGKKVKGTEWVTFEIVECAYDVLKRSGGSIEEEELNPMFEKLNDLKKLVRQDIIKIFYQWRARIYAILSKWIAPVLQVDNRKDEFQAPIIQDVSSVRYRLFTEAEAVKTEAVKKYTYNEEELTALEKDMEEPLLSEEAPVDNNTVEEIKDEADKYAPFKDVTILHKLGLGSLIDRGIAFITDVGNEALPEYEMICDDAIVVPDDGTDTADGDFVACGPLFLTVEEHQYGAFGTDASPDTLEERRAAAKAEAQAGCCSKVDIDEEEIKDNESNTSNNDSESEVDEDDDNEDDQIEDSPSTGVIYSENVVYEPYRMKDVADIINKRDKLVSVFKQALRDTLTIIAANELAVLANSNDGLVKKPEIVKSFIKKLTSKVSVDQSLRKLELLVDSTLAANERDQVDLGRMRVVLLRIDSLEHAMNTGVLHRDFTQAKSIPDDLIIKSNISSVFPLKFSKFMKKFDEDKKELINMIENGTAEFECKKFATRCLFGKEIPIDMPVDELDNGGICDGIFYDVYNTVLKTGENGEDAVYGINDDITKLLLYAFKHEYMNYSDALKKYGGVKRISLYDDDILRLQLSNLQRLGKPIDLPRVPMRNLVALAGEKFRSFKNQITSTINSTRSQVDSILKELGFNFDLLKKKPNAREADKQLESNLETFRGAIEDANKSIEVDKLSVRMAELFWHFNTLMNYFTDQVKQLKEKVPISKSDLDNEQTCLASTFANHLLNDVKVLLKKSLKYEHAKKKSNIMIQTISKAEALFRQILSVPIFLEYKGKNHQVASKMASVASPTGAISMETFRSAIIADPNFMEAIIGHRFTVKNGVLSNNRHHTDNDENLNTSRSSMSSSSSDDVQSTRDTYIDRCKTLLAIISVFKSFRIIKDNTHRRLISISKQSVFKRRMDIDAQMNLCNQLVEQFLNNDLGCEEHRILPGTNKTMMDAFMENFSNELRGTLEIPSAKATPILHYIIPMSSLRQGTFHKPHKFPAAECKINMIRYDDDFRENGSTDLSSTNIEDLDRLLADNFDDSKSELREGRVELTGGAIRFHFTRCSTSETNPMESREILLDDVSKIVQEGNYFTVYFDSRRSDRSLALDNSSIALKAHAVQSFRKYVHPSDANAILRGATNEVGRIRVRLDDKNKLSSTTGTSYDGSLLGSDQRSADSSLASSLSSSSSRAGEDTTHVFGFALKYNDVDGASFQFQILDDQVRELFDLILKEAELDRAPGIFGYEGDIKPHNKADCIIRDGEGIQTFSLPLAVFGETQRVSSDDDDTRSETGIVVQTDDAYQAGRVVCAQYAGSWENHRFHGEGTYRSGVPGELSSKDELQIFFNYEFEGQFRDGNREGFGTFRFPRPLPVLLETHFAEVEVQGEFRDDALSEIKEVQTLETGRIISRWTSLFNNSLEKILSLSKDGVVDEYNVEYKKHAEIIAFSLLHCPTEVYEASNVNDWKIDLARSKIFSRVRGIQYDTVDNPEDQWCRGEFIPHLTRWADTRINPLTSILLNRLIATTSSDVDENGFTLLDGETKNVFARLIDDDTVGPRANVDSFAYQISSSNYTIALGNLSAFGNESVKMMTDSGKGESVLPCGKFAPIDAVEPLSPYWFKGEVIHGLPSEGTLCAGRAIYVGELDGFKPKNGHGKLMYAFDLYDFLDIEGNNSVKQWNRTCQSIDPSAMNREPQHFYNLPAITLDSFHIGSAISDCTCVIWDGEIVDFKPHGYGKLYFLSDPNNSTTIDEDHVLRLINYAEKQGCSVYMSFEMGNPVRLTDEICTKFSQIVQKLYEIRKKNLLILLEDSQKKMKGPLRLFDAVNIKNYIKTISESATPLSYSELQAQAASAPQPVWKSNQNEILRGAHVSKTISLVQKKSDALMNLLSTSGFETLSPTINGRRTPINALVADIIVGALESYNEWKVEEQQYTNKLNVSRTMEFTNFAAEDDTRSRFKWFSPAGASPVMYVTQGAIVESGVDSSGFCDLYVSAYPSDFIVSATSDSTQNRMQLLKETRGYSNGYSITDLKEKCVNGFSGRIVNNDLVFAESFKYFRQPSKNNNRSRKDALNNDVVTAAPEIEALSVVYTGEMWNYLPHGVGVWRTGNCMHYIGNFSNGLPDGEGVLVDPVTQLPIFEGKFSMGAPQFGKVYILCPVSKLGVPKNCGTAVEGIPDVVDRHFCYEGPVDSTGRPHTIVENLDDSELWVNALNPASDKTPIHKSLGRGVYVRDEVWEKSFGLDFGSSNAETAIYIGEYREGLRHGRGKLLVGGICVYQGTWSYDFPNSGSSDVRVKNFVEKLRNALDTGIPMNATDSKKLASDIKEDGNLSWVAWRWAGLNGQAAKIEIPDVVKDLINSITLNPISVLRVDYPSISVLEKISGEINQLMDTTMARAWCAAASVGFGSQYKMQLLQQTAKKIHTSLCPELEDDMPAN